MQKNQRLQGFWRYRKDNKILCFIVFYVWKYVQLIKNPYAYLFYISIFARHHPTPCQIRPEKPPAFPQKPNRYHQIPGENLLLFAGVCHHFNRDQIPLPYSIQSAGQATTCRKNIFPLQVDKQPRNVPIYSERQFSQQLARFASEVRPTTLAPSGHLGFLPAGRDVRFGCGVI